MQPHQKKGSVKPFNKYLESLKPRPKLTEEQKQEKNKAALYMRKKFEKTQRYRDSLNG